MFNVHGAVSNVEFAMDQPWHRWMFFISTYQGAKNLRKTLFPEVSASQFSGVSSIADTEDEAATMARRRAEFFISIVVVDVLEKL